GQALNLPGQARQRLAGQHLSSSRQAAAARGYVEHLAAVTSLQRYWLADVDADPDLQGQGRVALHLLRKAILQLNRGAQCLPSRGEDCQRLIAPQLDDLACSRFHHLSADRSELRGEPRRRFIALLVGEVGVAPCIGEE